MIRNIIAISLFVLMFHSVSFSGDLEDYVERTDMDTPIHFAIGILGQQTVYNLLPDDFPGWSKSLISISAPILVGLIKESYFDDHFDKQDLGEYVLGATFYYKIKIKF